MIGRTISHYQILGKLGEGGMGEVFVAEDTRLGRRVAIKTLPSKLASDQKRRMRFEREAKALATLNHPNIVVVHSVEEAEGVHFITMELVEGKPLDRVIPEGGMSLDTLLDFATHLAEALAAAHEKGITHRDLKPANVMISEDSRVKVLDFGLAMLSESSEQAGEETVTQKLTQDGRLLGTVPYMSPEQIQGKALDHRTDIFSLGIILYQLATGRHPFSGDNTLTFVTSILRDEPIPVASLNPRLPARLARLIMRCLRKDREHRPQTVAEVLGELNSVPRGKRSPFWRLAKPRILIPVSLVLLVVAALFVTMQVRRSRALSFRSRALPEIQNLVDQEHFGAALNLAIETERVAGKGSVPQALWDSASRKVTVLTEPPGANLSVRAYDDIDGEWMLLGASPLDSVRVPRGFMRWRAEKGGYASAELASSASAGSLMLSLEGIGSIDSGMVRVPGGEIDLWGLLVVSPRTPMQLGDFLIDRHEVTNRQFSEFVKAGGYRRPEFWTHEFSERERTLSFEDAMRRFEDATGRPGPATWALGAFPDGQADHPVSGVSWYEAAAYASYANKELPSLYHWYWAAGAADIWKTPWYAVPLSNFGGDGTLPVGSSSALVGHGVYDMTGNVREWCANATGDQHILLGGAWGDPSYAYGTPDRQSPFDRAPGNGFRCMSRLGDDSVPEEAIVPIPASMGRDFAREQPVSDDVFQAFKRFFEHDKIPLESKTEWVDTSSEHWIKERVSYAAGHGHDRMMANLYTPLSGSPPFQVVICMSGGGIFFRESSVREEDIHSWDLKEYLIRSGRAVLYPVWKGAYERQDGFDPFESGVAPYREHMIQWVKEMHQSIDYLETRPEIDAGKVAYSGSSFGAVMAPLFLSLESRLKAAILILGGLPTGQWTPETDMLNYAPRVNVPVLMLNGRYDSVFPLEASQQPLLRFLGTPDEHKRLGLYDAGHTTSGWRLDLMRESLDWLDRYLGVVG